jgi:hypothetical protein
MPGAYLLHLPTGATLTASSEDAAYPVDNLKDRQGWRVFRATSGTAVSISIDFGTALSCDTVALVNHNLTAGATMSLKAGATSPPSSVVATPAYRAHDLWKAFTATAARYWLLEITDANPAAIQIGQLLLGTRVSLPRARRIGESYKPATMRQNITGETYGGGKYSYHLHSARGFNPTFRVLGSQIDIFDTLDAAVRGDVIPFLYIPDDTESAAYWVRKEMSFEPVEIDKAGGGIVHDYQMMLIEESRGLEVME